MDERIFEALFLVGLFVATVIRSYYGVRFRRKEITHVQKEHPIVFIGMAIWCVVLVLPFITIFSNWLTIADYIIPVPLSAIETENQWGQTGNQCETNGKPMWKPMGSDSIEYMQVFMNYDYCNSHAFLPDNLDGSCLFGYCQQQMENLG